MKYSCKAVVGHGQKCEPNYQCDACAAKQKYIPRIEKLEAALRSIAANACCDSCREAALVARKVLGEKECETCSHYSFKVWGIDRSISGKCFGWGKKSKYVNGDDTCERWSMEKKDD